MAKFISKILLIAILYISTLFVSAGTSYALTTPSFPACANPQGTIKVTYDSGVHGVVGDSTNYSGKDTVYTLSNNTLMQCLCPTNGGGIQTNWIKASGYNQDEIQILKSQGWIYVADGSAWGLDPEAYLAQNSSFSCNGQGGGSSSSSSSSNSSNSVMGASAGVIGLANTGNTLFIAIVLLAGIFSSIFGIVLSRRK